MLSIATLIPFMQLIIEGKLFAEMPSYIFDDSTETNRRSSSDIHGVISVPRFKIEKTLRSLNYNLTKIRYFDHGHAGVRRHLKHSLSSDTVTPGGLPSLVPSIVQQSVRSFNPSLLTSNIPVMLNFAEPSEGPKILKPQPFVNQTIGSTLISPFIPLRAPSTYPTVGQTLIPQFSPQITHTLYPTLDNSRLPTDWSCYVIDCGVACGVDAPSPTPSAQPSLPTLATPSESPPIVQGTHQ